MRDDRFKNWLKGVLEDVEYITPAQACEAAARILTKASIAQKNARNFISQLSDEDKDELAMALHDLGENDKH